MSRERVAIALAAIFILIRCWTALPPRFQSDEQKSFGAALLTFDPYGHQPPPPSYPVYVAAGRLLHFFIRRPLPTLLALSVGSALAGFVLFSIAFGRLLRAPWIGIAAALALYVSPPVRYLSSHTAAEPLAFALLAAALLFWLRGEDVSFAIALALAIGVRPQLCVAVIAWLVTASVLRPAWRGLVAFVATLAISFEPVVAGVGIDRLQYFVANAIAAERLRSVSGSLSAVLHAFVVEPWGMGTLVVFAAAALGLAGALIRREKALFPLAAFTVAHLLFAVAAGTRIESVRPFVPALIGISLFAAAAVPAKWRLS